MTKLNDGPIVTVTRSCSGCKHERSQSYKVQGDSGQDVYCHHPDTNGNYIGDTDWHTPDWCPVLKAQQPAGDVVRDAERYRFLAERCRSASEHWGGRWWIVIDGPAPKSHDSEDDFDAAIDAALASSARKGE